MPYCFDCTLALVFWDCMETLAVSTSRSPCLAAPGRPTASFSDNYDDTHELVHQASPQSLPHCCDKQWSSRRYSILPSLSMGAREIMNNPEFGENERSTLGIGTVLILSTSTRRKIHPVYAWDTGIIFLLHFVTNVKFQNCPGKLIIHLAAI